MTTPEHGKRADAVEHNQVFQDAEGHQTTNPSTAIKNADSEADRNEERLKQGETGPGIPEE
jgi:hypothetical protein